MGQLSDIPVLFQDPAVLVINKPAGLATLPDGYDPTLPHIKSLLEHRYGPLWIVHRLDKDTSGVLLLARSAAAHRSLNTQFERHHIVKIYHALVIGNPGWQEKTINLPLKPNGDRQHRTIVDLQRGKAAITHLKILERFVEFSLLEVIPETGRTHQIRCHLSTSGFPILGDKLYSKPIKSENVGHENSTQREIIRFAGLMKSMGLHAQTLEFDHPFSGKRLNIQAPYPSDFTVVLSHLRKS
jgi:RluA family pseudouridine synthase